MMTGNTRTIIVYDTKNARRANILFWVSVMCISGIFIGLQEWLKTSFKHNFNEDYSIIGLLLITVVPMYLLVLWLESRYFACRLEIAENALRIMKHENIIQSIDIQQIETSYFRRINRNYYWFIGLKHESKNLKIKLQDRSYEKNILELCQAHQIPITN